MLLLLVHLVLVEAKVWRNEKRGEKGRKKGPTFFKKVLHKYVRPHCNHPAERKVFVKAPRTHTSLGAQRQPRFHMASQPGASRDSPGPGHASPQYEKK